LFECCRKDIIDQSRRKMSAKLTGDYPALCAPGRQPAQSGPWR
jgi:hypothetical protein